MRRMAQVGLGARGITYIILGWLVLAIALHHSAQKANDKGAFETLAQNSFGRALLGMLAVGFAGYALWRLAAALGRSSSHESMKPLHRAGALGQALVYGFLCYLATMLTVGASSKGGSGDPAPLTARIMRSTSGQAAVIVAAIIIVGAGAFLAIRGAQRRFERELKTELAGPAGHDAVVTFGVIGSVTRGLVVMLVGVFLLQAGLQRNAAHAKGLDASLVSLGSHAYGTVALIAVAIGVECFGAFSLLETRHLRI